MSADADAGFNAGLGMAGSWYAASTPPLEPQPGLRGEFTADVVVVGGGFTGLTAALRAAELGFRVVLLEAGRIGWGASGRNGGQMIPGLRKGAAELIARYGAGRARSIFDTALEARAVTLHRIETHAIACDLTLNGHLLGAARRRDVGWMGEETRALETVMAYPHARMLDAAETADEVGGGNYAGGLLDAGGGHLNPLAYALGLARAGLDAGVRLFETSPVLDIAPQPGGGVLARTARGQVRARYGVLACDALIGGLDRAAASHIMPVASYVGATAPLRDPRALIPRDVAVSDSRFVVSYYRLTPDGRLLFGGGERYSPHPPRDMAGFVRRHMTKVFPQLKDTAIEHAWGGLVSVTRSRLPHVGRRGDLFYAHGYSGQGVLVAGLAGTAVAEAMAGTASRFDVLAGLAPPAFPGGPALRDPLYLLGMTWFALRDRL